MSPAILTPPAETRLAATPGELVRAAAKRQFVSTVRTDQLWLATALALSLLFAARTMAPAFEPGDVVQDDARHFLFWMAQWYDAELFRNDLIADYYQAVTPVGYTALYWALHWLTPPLTASKLLPLVLGLAAALSTFALTRQLHPAPAGGFLAAVLLSWYVWQYGDLASAGPRAFALPLLTITLWLVASRRLAWSVALTGLAALFYPAASALGVALLGVQLVRLKGWRPALTHQRSAWLAFVVAGLLAGGLLLASQSGSSQFGPIVSGDQAREMAEFRDEGRHGFFLKGAYRYWVLGAHSGLHLSATDSVLAPTVPLLYEYAALAALLPILIVTSRCRTELKRLSPEIVLLPQLVVASFGLFFLAHLMLFQLYHPSRYVKWSLPLALAVSAGIGLTILFRAMATRLPRGAQGGVRTIFPIMVGVALILYPARDGGVFIRDEHPAVTAFLRTQPSDTLVAGVPSDADSIPTFAHRRVLAGGEYADAYHLGYYGQMRGRIEDLVEAYYADSTAQVAEFAARYGVDVLLVNRVAFDRRRAVQAWGTDFKPFTSRVTTKLRDSSYFVLPDLAARCAVLDDGTIAIVPTSCIRGQV